MEQLDIAVYNTAHKTKGEMGELAQKLGMTYQVLVNKTNGSERNILSLSEAFELIIHTKNISILRVMAQEMGYALVQMVSEQSSCIFMSVLKATAEHGDVAQTIKDSLDDKVITNREQAAIREEIDEAIHAQEELKVAVAEVPM